MTSIKLKFRPSLRSGNEGLLYYQIIHNRVVRQLSSGYKVFNSEWNASKSLLMNGVDAHRNQVLNDIRTGIQRDMERWHRIIQELECRGLSYHSDEVIAGFQRVQQEHSLFRFMECVIAQLRQRGRVRTADSYQSALSSFRTYRKGEDLLLDAITSQELLTYEASMARRGLCPNTTSYYMRILRAVYNRAVEEGMIEQKYPFKAVYTGVSKTVKRAISLSYIRRLKQLELPVNSSLALARDLFLFSFYTRGMSFVDMIHLRKQNVQGGIICYRRRKTGQLLTIKIEKCMQKLIDRYQREDSEYLFPMIHSAENAYRDYRNALKLMNVRLKEIGRRIGTPIKLTTYVGRHSWGSAAKMNHIPLSVISESMGHDSEQTTLIYLASLDTSVINQANAKILNKL
jgi:integrase